MFAIEYVIDDIARKLGKDPLHVRRVNFYGQGERNVTHYQQVVEDNIIDDLFDQLLASSDYVNRRAEIRRYNEASKVLRRGLAITPVKFGMDISVMIRSTSSGPEINRSSASMLLLVADTW